MRLIFSFLLLFAASAQSATYYYDPTGNDGAAGSSVAPFRTWANFVSRVNSVFFKPGDVVNFRPGFYPFTGVYPAMHGGGGTAALPITIQVDPATSGDVEIMGATTTTPGSWTQANKCTAGADTSVTPNVSAIGVPCDSAADCGTGGVCTPVIGLFWASAAESFGSTGSTAGVAFQTGAVPGADPKIFPIVFSDLAVPITMPDMTSGDKSWPYSEMVAICKSVHNPWFCCTGAGTGSGCHPTRLYARLATSINPGSASPPVSFPQGPIIDANGSGGTTTDYMYFLAGPGRKFFFRWSPTDILLFRHANNWKFQGFKVQFNSRIWPHTIANGHDALSSQSAFPRDGGGAEFLILFVGEGALFSGTTEHHDFSFTDGYIGNSLNEALHMTETGVLSGSCAAVTDCTNTALGKPASCSSTGQCYYTRTYNIDFGGPNLSDTVEFAQGGWAQLNGTAANSASEVGSWPPVNYPTWSNIFKTHWSPLGGGGQTGGPWIIRSMLNHLNHVYVHDNVSPAQFEQDQLLVWGNEITNSYFDSDLSKYQANGNAVLIPTAAVSQCNPGPSGANCAGYGGGRDINFGGSFLHPGVPGTKWANDFFVNLWNTGFIADCCGIGVHQPVAPNTNLVLNSYFGLKGNGLYITGSQDGISFPGLWNGIFKNNIINQQNPLGGSSAASLRFNSNGLANVDSNNNWFSPGVALSWGGSPLTFTSYVTAAAPDENLSFQGTITLDSNGCPVTGSPGIDAGVDISSFGITTDYFGNPRKIGNKTDIGPCEAPLSSTTTVLVVTTSTSTSSTSTSTTSTSTVTTLAATTSTSTTSTTTTTLCAGCIIITPPTFPTTTLP